MRQQAMNPETLLGNAAWMAGLARHIVEDRAAADDIVQEAWLAALSAKTIPEGDGPRRGWLATVTRRLAWGHQRTRRRARNREARAAKPEAEASTLKIVERAEAHRALVEAVLALQEPYRGLILERYFENRSAAEIARRRGARAATVRSQIQRGLEKLRGRFDDRDQRGLALALIPLALRAPAAVSAVAIGLGVAKGAAVLLALGLGLLAVAQLGKAPRPRPPLRGADATRAAAIDHRAQIAPISLRSPALAKDQSATPPTQPPRSTPALELAPANTAPPLGLIAPSWLKGEVRGRVEDLRGRPVVGARVLLYGWQESDTRSVTIAPDKRPVLARSDAEGRFTIDGPLPDRGLLAARALGHVTAFRTRFKRGQEREALIIVGQAQAPITGLVVDEAGRPLAGAEVQYLSFNPLQSGPPRELDRSRLDQARFGAITDAAGRFGIAGLPELPGGQVFASRKGYDTATRGISELVADPTLVLKSAAVARLTGRVRHADGRPAAGAEIWLDGRLGRADAEGRFDFRIEPDQASEKSAILALLPGWQPVAIPVTRQQLRALEPMELTLPGPALTIAGRVLDAAGRPLSGWRVDLEDAVSALDAVPRTTAESLADPRRDAADLTTDEAGRFRFGGLRDRVYRVVARDLKTGRSARAALQAGEESAVLRLGDDDVYRRLTGRVVSASGLPVSGVQVCGRFVLSDSGSAIQWGSTAEVTSDESGRFELIDFPKESVRVRVSGAEVMPLILSLPQNPEASELVIRVALRRRLKVVFGHLQPPPEKLAILDPAGRALPMMIFYTPGSYTELTSLRLMAGNEATEVLTVPDNAAGLRLSFPDGRVRSLALNLDADTVTVLRP